MKHDLVSVILPVFNAEKHVSESIRSVLNQSHENLELIIVNDASTDESVKRIREFSDPRIKCIELTENGGAGKARNHGIRQGARSLHCFYRCRRHLASGKALQANCVHAE